MSQSYPCTLVLGAVTLTLASLMKLLKDGNSFMKLAEIGAPPVVYNRVPWVTADFWLIKPMAGHNGRDSR